MNSTSEMHQTLLYIKVQILFSGTIRSIENACFCGWFLLLKQVPRGKVSATYNANDQSKLLHALLQMTRVVTERSPILTEKLKGSTFSTLSSTMVVLLSSKRLYTDSYRPSNAQPVYRARNRTLNLRWLKSISCFFTEFGSGFRFQIPYLLPALALHLVRLSFSNFFLNLGVV